MGRIRLPARPDPVRIQSARVAAARVGTASAQAAVTEEIASIEAGIPPDLSDTIDTLNTTIADLNDRVNELEGA
jgi:ABC-type transporter Mla subunit MlaD